MAKDKDDAVTAAPQIIERVVITKTREEVDAEKEREKRAAHRAEAMKGLEFPLLVTATQEGFFAGHRIRVGMSFSCPTAALYSIFWMKPADAHAKDDLAEILGQAPRRPRRSGERGNPEAPAATRGPIALSQAAGAGVI